MEKGKKIRSESLRQINQNLSRRFLGSLLETAVYRKEVEDEFLASLINLGNEDYPDIRWARWE